MKRNMKGLVWTGLVTVVAIASGCQPYRTEVLSSSPTQPPAQPPQSAPAAPPPPETSRPTQPPQPDRAIAPSPAPAIAPPKPDPAPASIAQACDAPQTQAAMNQCAHSTYRVADQRLNEVYQDLKASLSAPEQAQLIDAELAWIDYRDSSCDAESSQYEGGSIQPTIYYGCMERLTESRTEQLQQQLN